MITIVIFFNIQSFLCFFCFSLWLSLLILHNVLFLLLIYYRTFITSILLSASLKCKICSCVSMNCFLTKILSLLMDVSCLIEHVFLSILHNLFFWQDYGMDLISDVVVKKPYKIPIEYQRGVVAQADFVPEIMEGEHLSWMSSLFSTCILFKLKGDFALILLAT